MLYIKTQDDQNIKKLYKKGDFMFLQIMIIFVTLMASFIGSLSGFGLSTIMLPISLMLMDAEKALLFVGIVHFFESSWKLYFFHKDIDYYLIKNFGLPSIIASAFGAYLSLSIDQNILKKIIGLFLCTLIITSYKQVNWQFKKKERTALFGGSVSGFFAGLTGMGGALRAAFLSVFDLSKTAFISTLAFIAIITDTARLIVYSPTAKICPVSLWKILAICIPVSFFGVWIAQKTILYISEKTFRRIIEVSLFIIGLKLIIWG